jgi:hypothetical protein
MKNIIKLAFVLVSFVAFSSANAGVLEVTGTAKATYVISGSDSTTAVNNEGKGLGIENELAFTGKGELDNGWKWTYQVQLDDTSAETFTATDDTRLELSTPYGTIAAYNTEGSLSTKYSHGVAAYAVGTDAGNSGSMNYGTNIDSYNNLQYHTPAGLLPFGISAKVAVAPSASSRKVAANDAGDQNSASVGDRVTQYQVTAAPVDGLSVGASYLERSGESGRIQGYEQGGFFAKYAIGQVSFGYGKHYVANNISAQSTQSTTADLSTAAEAAKTKHFENTAYGIGFKVNDSLSISYGREQSEAAKRTLTDTGRTSTKNNVELSVDAIQAAYTMGGMTISVSMKDIENADYILAKDEKETLIAVSMAF